ncbi:MAG: hypothetical protein M3X11_05925, partial [Acidobacteriota bacterium]|nr:hypothetical protein [Acidobacteriota bacterium]
MRKLIIVLTCLLILYLVFIAFPSPLVALGSAPLDRSWIYAINYLPASAFAYGRDVTFTYGPLGYLMYQLPVGATIYHALWLKLSFLALFGSLLVFYLIKLKDRLAIWLFALCYLAARVNGFNDLNYDYYLIFLNALLVGLALRTERLRWLLLLLSAALAGVALFIKFSTGIAFAAMLAVTGVLLIAWRRPLWKVAVASWGAYLLIVVVLSAKLLGSPAYLGQWLKASLEIATGYVSAMSLYGERKWLLWGVIAVVIYMALTAWLSVRRRRTGFIALMLLLPVLMDFKGGFVRQGIGHELIFYTSLPVLMSALVLNAEGRREQLLCVAACLAVIVMGTIRRESAFGPTPWGREITREMGQERPINNIRLLANLDQWVTNVTAAYQTELQAIKPDDDWFGLIDQKRDTVDVVPWEIVYCPAGGWKWSPTPTLQLYSAYTAWLDNWDAEHFTRAQAPDFVIGEYVSLDNRYLLWDAPATWRAIMNNYEVVGVNGQKFQFLLKRKTQIAEPVMQKVREATTKPLEWVDVPASEQPLYVEIKHKLSLKGQLTKALLRLPAVMLELEYESGRIAGYRAMPDVIRNGLLINYQPVGAEQLTDLFNCKMSERVRRFRVAGRGAEFMQSEISLIWKKIATPCAAPSQ